MRILYLEDNQNDAQLIAKYVQTTPHTVVIAPNIAAARQQLSFMPDLILMDVMIDSERAGFEFARELRASGYTQPMVAVTALNTKQDQLDCQQAGFDAVVTKPFQIHEVVELINHFGNHFS
jgi:CheY-like chemotaxis protein